jgi:acetate kinase
MKILVVNVGSTSIKYQLYEMDTETALARGVVERVGTGAAVHVHPGGREPLPGVDLRGALDAVLGRLRADGGPLAAGDLRAVGHRVVHGGERLVAPALVDDAVREAIREHARFAPLHNPANLAGIEAAQAVAPDCPHVAVFDTAFHAELPPHAYLYALPYELYLEGGLRRYGFHGPSHQYMAARAAEHLQTDPARLKLVTCHLGGGASVAAIDGGRVVDTSMGMTPL